MYIFLFRAAVTPSNMIFSWELHISVGERLPYTSFTVNSYGKFDTAPPWYLNQAGCCDRHWHRISINGRMQISHRNKPHSCLESTTEAVQGLRKASHNSTNFLAKGFLKKSMLKDFIPAFLLLNGNFIAHISQHHRFGRPIYFFPCLDFVAFLLLATNSLHRFTSRDLPMA